ncbi:hypothetical protein GQ43DRAFT_432072 [Delitschia confertaspora ATCC 74209]|uniref:Cyclin domain protein n=1 Tax=Delitschia confertaspora ATCC 74209 TaxID=1513339 RepID=A0A9P4JMI2_9PLEO|nr:hypothetical protein GQ43DRAFT_432072 [Delitschia confertaspora ATCC 74209]
MATEFANPLATEYQLMNSSSQIDRIPDDLEKSIRFAGARLTQAAGILLRLPQEVIAQAIVIFTRFWIGPEGGSLVQYGAEEVSAASIYLVSKISSYPKSPRSVINVYSYLRTLPSTFVEPNSLGKEDLESYFVSEGTYQSRRAALFAMETQILKILGFNLTTVLPYKLCINYIQTLGVFNQPHAPELVKRAFAHLNTALLSHQLLYMTHQPPWLATAAIYLAAKEEGIKLPEVNWWEFFDTDVEELGFLVCAFLDIEGFAAGEEEKWGKRKVPMTVEEVEDELEKRRILDGGN